MADGNAAPQEPVTGTAPQEPTTTPGDKGGSGNSAEDRIAGLVAERNRKDTQLTEAARKIETLERLIETNKTDDEKRMDELVTSRAAEMYGADLDRLKGIESGVTELVNAELTQLPEDYHGLVSETAPAHERLRQIRTAQKLIADKARPGGGGGPSVNPVTTSATVTKAAFDVWREKASSMDPNVRAEYKRDKEKFQSAYKAGTIEGMP